MIDVVEITLKEFKEDIYNEYIRLFPDSERRDLKKIEKTYKKGIEKFYKILLMWKKSWKMRYGKETGGYSLTQFFTKDNM